VPVNLLPEEGRGHDEGLSVLTVVLAAVTMLLVLVWGGSAIVKDYLLRSDVRARLEAAEPQVKEARGLQDEITELRRQLDILVAGQDRRVTALLKELSDMVPADAYLTSLNLRGDRLTLDGQARSASDIITALEKSKHLKNVSFTSPITRTGDKERFSLTAELER
jgi:general secretion pathway protein L